MFPDEAFIRGSGPHFRAAAFQSRLELAQGPLNPVFEMLINGQHGAQAA